MLYKVLYGQKDYTGSFIAKQEKSGYRYTNKCSHIGYCNLARADSF